MATQKQPRGLYEVYLMLSPTLSESARDGALKRIHGSIEELKGKVLKSHDLGHRKLCYPIKKHAEAYCYLCFFEIDPSQVLELEQHHYKLNEDLLRYMIVRAEAVLEKLEYKTLESVATER